MSRFTMIISVKTEDENTEVIDRIAELAACLARNKQRKRGLNPDEWRQEEAGGVAAEAAGSKRRCDSKEVGGTGQHEEVGATAMEGPAAGGAATARE